MSPATRKSKVTPETQAEAARLSELWKNRADRMTQAEFGVKYEVGNQSAVGQFLRGEVPLSLKAAAGFASYLQCQIGDFSPRLAKFASSVAPHVENTTPQPHMDMTTLNRVELEVVMLMRSLSSSEQAEVVQLAQRLYRSRKPPAA
ncbi:MAG: hypothetical protein KIT86_00775 [Hydrogenophaga sp.]|uniref:hypothetical protein n=1 Tax=Hydrogenophaga sp. TaxID=1904254 RepID=UPI0026328411|nr:hypothetical protein [Hydrogenophaga sp.]MCW5668160.1 hypothetical protein [Hydrogenophaga sp.]